MLVVADSSPLVYLSRVGVLDLLATAFGEVVVPGAVWAEVVDARPDAPGVSALQAASWLRVDRRDLPPADLAAATIFRLLGEVPDEVSDAALLARLHQQVSRGEGGDSHDVLLGVLSLHGIAAEVLDPSGELDRVALSGAPVVARVDGRYVVIAPTRGGRVVRLGDGGGRVRWAAAFVQGAPPPR